ncbi:MalY/PatB family protein [Sinanaerobacter chloroacetimidivorans]|uniref:cysteine-S-conjugate beta-lyase n=1 Tax=Sinanaerobacter chloroacetimidivorans TaxID=2818044 RepID=A0A8J7VXC5_9FIRM|nr:PatB family C-S lyase [Sinanaerobacter chloroacetimidivorans]MBR0596436.1 PatB family C-S lyase [Sinanaerobacter chloroacetimidivorans]
MNYDFDEIIDRKSTNAMNTDGFRSYIFHTGPNTRFKFADDEFVRMWVADMEFTVADPIRNALKDWVDKRIYGYTQVYEAGYYEAFSAWCKRHYDWNVPVKELTFSTGVVPAVFQLIEILVKQGEKVLTLTPGYGQFQHAADYNHVELVQSALISNNGYFTIDFNDFEKCASDPMIKLIILCNPHNPSGRIWTKEELEKIAQITRKYNLWIVSDEIHCDLVRQGLHHTPMAKVMSDYQKLVTCMAPSKTFNIAGLMLSDIIIRDENLQKTFMERDKNVGCLNPFSIVAHIAAFNEGDEWLGQLKTYLDGNFEMVKTYLNENLPEAVFKIPEATYLAWVDLSKCLPANTDFSTFFANEAGVLLEGGSAQFIGNGEGYVRLNMAMPRATVKEGMKRICNAIKNANKK